MLELKVLENVSGKLAINYEEMKRDLAIQLEKYRGLTFTENEIVEAKSVRANLNKVAKVIDDRRKELKKEFLKPYEIVEKQANELVGMIKEVNSTIDNQIKEFEEREKEHKKDQIFEIWDSKHYNKIGLLQIFDNRWLNKTYTLVAINKDIDDKIIEIENNLKSISALVNDKDKVLELQSKYLITLDLNKTIQDYELEKIKKDLLQNQEETIEVVQEQEQEQEYILQFEVVATEKQINALSKFLKENNYKYRKL